MRRRRNSRSAPWLVTLGLALSLGPLAGCPLAHEAPNTTACYSNMDCFPGEYCEMPAPGTRKQGEPGVCTARTGSVPPDSGAGQGYARGDGGSADDSKDRGLGQDKDDSRDAADSPTPKVDL